MGGVRSASPVGSCLPGAVLALALLLHTQALSETHRSGQVVAGQARFTVITPECIRLEYNPAGKFIDEPSYFAINRDTRDADARVSTEDGRTVIDTGVLVLTY